MRHHIRNIENDKIRYGLKMSGFSFSSRLLYALLRGPICFLKNRNIFNRFVYRRMRLYARERGTIYMKEEQRCADMFIKILFLYEIMFDSQ